MSSLPVRLLLATVLLLPALRLDAQAPVAPADPERHLRLTVFRNPSTGLEYQQARFGVSVGYYPTILRRTSADEQRTTNWIRLGVSVWSHTTGPSLYASVSGMYALTKGWKNGVLVDVGGRWPVTSFLAPRLGVAVLQTSDGLTRVNPTVGFDIPLRRW